ncbi:MAG TPA: molybdopterin-dependent oxidoreductase [Coriobacteriia bacterium]|nr:molybdopterin-dependent oxidoreductase [Coriobacteriia bacterium]
MNGRRDLRHLGVALLLAAVLTAMLGGCSRPESEEGGSGGTTKLAPSEVQEYEGKRLGSVDDFRENSIKGPQQVDIDSYRLSVLGEVEKPLSLTYDQAIDREQFEKVVRINCVEGWSVDILWKGVLLRDLLEAASYDPAASTIIFRCEDGYSTSLPLSFVLDRDILLAYQMNGVDLPTERGYPFQVVAEDKWGYKWAKWVTSIEVSNDSNYRGYWEQRGYDNDADLPSSK